MSFGLLFLTSVIAGLVAAMGGMGGGLILIPTLTAFGIDIKQAIAISNLSLVAISNSAALGDIRRHMPNLRVGAFLEVFAVIGAFGGALTTLILGKQILFFLCGIFFILCGISLWRERKESWKSPSRQDAFSRQLGWEGSYYDHVERKTINYQGNHAGFAGLFMCLAGAISVLLGSGGRALIVLICDKVVGLPPKVSLTTSNLIIGLIALAGVNVYLEAGLISPNLVAPVIPGITIGALIGSRLLVYFSNRVARRTFLVMLIVLGLQLILRIQRIR